MTSEYPWVLLISFEVPDLKELIVLWEERLKALKQLKQSSDGENKE